MKQGEAKMNKKVKILTARRVSAAHENIDKEILFYITPVLKIFS